MKKRLPILAKLGCVTLSLDHKYIKNCQGDEEDKALGLVAMISCDGKRTPFTLGYLATNDATDEETIRLVEETLEEYGIFESFKNLEIPFTTDCGLRTAMEQLHHKHNLTDLHSICTCHNMGRLQKRCIQLLPTYLDDADELLKQLKINIDEAKSMDNYFKSLPVNALDREILGELLHKNWSKMDANQRDTAKLKYLSIPKEFNIRFRNAYERTAGLLSRWNELQRIKSDISHPMHGFVDNLDLSDRHFNFLKAIHEMRSHLIHLVDYYESDNNFQTTETINSVIFGFQYALNISKSDELDLGLKMSLLDALTEQLSSHKAIKNANGSWIWKRTKVPSRVRRMDKIGAFAFAGEQKLILPRLTKALKEAKKYSRRYKSKFQVNKKIKIVAIYCNIFKIITKNCNISYSQNNLIFS